MARGLAQELPERSKVLGIHMSSPPVADRREYRSLPLHLPLQFAREGRSEQIDCVTESISADEVYFVASELIERGERMEINVLLPLKKRSGNAVKMRLKCLGKK